MMQTNARQICFRVSFGALAIIWVFVSGCARLELNPFAHTATGIHARTGLAMRPPHAWDSPIPPHVDLNDGLSEDEAAVTGLWNNAQFLELLTDLDLSRADLIEARQLTNPQVQTMFPVGVKQWELALFVPMEAMLVRPRRVAAAQLEMQRVGERVVQDGLNVVRDVRVAYADLVRANQRWQLAQYGARLQSENARRGEAMLRGGATSPLDVSPLRLNAMLAQREVIQAAQEAEVARQRLLMLMGVQFVDVPFNPVPQQTTGYLTVSADELVKQAISSRPDLQAAHFAIVANQERAKLTNYDYINFTGVLPDLNSKGEKGYEAGPGLNLTIPLFNQNQGAKAKTAAQLEKSRRNFFNLRNAAALEVRQAHARFVRAERELGLLQNTVIPEANAGYQRMQKALNEDAVSTLLVMQTTDQYLAARRLEIEAAAERQRAAAELERSVGGRLFNQPEPIMEGMSLSQRATQQLR